MAKAHKIWLFVELRRLLVVRKDIDVNEHERLSNTTLRHKLK